MFTNVSRRVLRRVLTRLVAAALGLAILAVPWTAVPAGATEPAEPVARQQTPISAIVDATRELLDAVRPNCQDAGAGEVPELVGSIFRCHLRRAGFAEPDVRRVAAEAVAVSYCESHWNPEAVVFDGRYVTVPNPATGYHYTAAGVFQFIQVRADQWIDGGYASVMDARRNIDAAARLYIHNRGRGYGGWDDWACAAANDGFKVGSVLPGWPGGPAALPDWAWSY